MGVLITYLCTCNTYTVYSGKFLKGKFYTSQITEPRLIYVSQYMHSTCTCNCQNLEVLQYYRQLCILWRGDTKLIINIPDYFCTLNCIPIPIIVGVAPTCMHGQTKMLSHHFIPIDITCYLNIDSQQPLCGIPDQKQYPWRIPLLFNFNTATVGSFPPYLFCVYTPTSALSDYIL